MIETGDLKKGVTIELDGVLYQVLDYQHIKMGRGSAQVRLKLRDVRGGHIIERTFQAGERFTRARVDRQSAQYLYADGDIHYFMNTADLRPARHQHANASATPSTTCARTAPATSSPTATRRSAWSCRPPSS